MNTNGSGATAKHKPGAGATLDQLRDDVHELVEQYQALYSKYEQDFGTLASIQLQLINGVEKLEAFARKLPGLVGNAVAVVLESRVGDLQQQLVERDRVINEKLDKLMAMYGPTRQTGIDRG